MSIAGVYEIVNLYDGKASSYIGSSVDIEKRWRHHRFTLCAGQHDNVYLQCAWDKYGEDAFVFSILEEVEGDMLLVMEQEYLDDYFDRGHCYNIARDAVASMRGKIFTKEHRDRISEANKDQVPWHKGRTNVYSEESLRKMSDAQKGKKCTEETKRKMSEANKGKTLSEEHKRKVIKALVGHAVSEETRRKISNGLMGHVVSEEARCKMRDARKGKKCSAQVRCNMSKAQKRRWAERRIHDAKGKHEE